MKIGFIDYYLDEWHANMYPAWIREASNGEMTVAYAYAEIASPHTGVTTEAWCQRMGIEQLSSMEELVEKSDAIVVLSPDNCERHEELSQLPLRSGKPVYIDKTFAPDLATAKRILSLAEANGTPCYSTSALRFADEYKNIDTAAITAANFWGPMAFETYSIHQLEPLFMLMKTKAEQVMMMTGENYYLLNIRFADGRVGSISGSFPDGPFAAQLTMRGGNRNINVTSDFFHNFIVELVDFFRTKEIKVPHDETLAIMAARSAALEAQEKPFTWIPVPTL
ncbi:MAG: hypothetical protein E7618_02875 [Ruminococcaceae bacterium]|nr:hypothetical protein [Oscillospiraceae bacterium]